MDAKQPIRTKQRSNFGFVCFYLVDPIVIKSVGQTVLFSVGHYATNFNSTDESDKLVAHPHYLAVVQVDLDARQLGDWQVLTVCTPDKAEEIREFQVYKDWRLKAFGLGSFKNGVQQSDMKPYHKFKQHSIEVEEIYTHASKRHHSLDDVLNRFDDFDEELEIFTKTKPHKCKDIGDKVGITWHDMGGPLVAMSVEKGRFLPRLYGVIGSPELPKGRQGGYTGWAKHIRATEYLDVINRVKS